MASVYSVLIRQTLREMNVSADAISAVSQRLTAVHAAQMVSFQKEVEAVAFGDLVMSAVKPYVDAGLGKLHLTGQGLLVERQKLTTIALSLQELATNSLKHGALGHSGEIDLCAKEVDGKTTVDWVERGGPTVQLPTRTSGSRIIRDLLAAAGGQINYDWRPEGLRASVLI